MIRLEKKNCNLILKEKPQIYQHYHHHYYHYKIDKHKHEYLAVEEILSPDQSRLTEQVKFTYSPLGKAFEKQIKTIEDQGRKLVEVLNVLNPAKHQEKQNQSKEFFQKS